MRVKKTIMCLITALMAQGMVARVVTIDNVTYDINESRGSAVLTDGKSVRRVNYDVPSSIQTSTSTYTVTEIGEQAFSGNTNIKNVVIPQSVTTIGDYAFKNCNQLKKISLEYSPQSIGTGAFYKCTNLEQVQVPADNYNYGYSAIIKDYAFYGCNELRNIANLRFGYSIGAYAFANCTNLTSDGIYLRSTSEIGEKAFFNCTSLKDLRLSIDLCDYGTSAFGNCVSVEEVELCPRSLGSKCFMNCKSLKKVTVYTSSEGNMIGDSCFMRCASLDTFQVMKLYMGWFGEDYEIGEREPVQLGTNVFLGANSLRHVYVDHQILGKYKETESWKKYAKQLEPVFHIFKRHLGYHQEIYIPGLDEDGHRDIVTYVYGEGKEVKVDITDDVYLLNGITLDDRSITDSIVMNGITTLTISNVDRDHVLIYTLRNEEQRYDFTYEGILYRVNPEEHYAMVIGRAPFYSSVGNLTIPDQVEFKGENYPVKKLGGMGYGYKKGTVSDITLPNTIEEISYACFSYNEWLQNVYFSEDSRLYEIGEQAFADCTRLESITFPSSLSRIGEDAFERCTSLREIRILSSFCDIAPNAFGDNDSLIIRVPYDYLESYKRRKNWEKYADKLVPFYTITVEEHDFYEDGHNNYYVGKYYDWNKEVIYSYNAYGNEYDVPFRLNIGDYVYQIIKDGKFVPVSEGQKEIHLDNIKRNIKIKLIIKHLGEEDHVHVGKYFYKIDTETKTAFLTDRDRSIEDVVVPPSFLFEGERYTVKGIIDGLGSIQNMRKTKRIELPRMISKLPSYICYNDINLTEVVFSEYSRIDTIGDEAFAYCTRLEEITLPSRLTYLGKEAFSGTPLSEVTLLSGMCTLGENAFGDVPSTFRIYVPSKYVQRYKRSASWEKYKDYIYAIEGDEENELRKMPLPMDEQLASFEDDKQEESSAFFQNGKVNVFNLSGRIIKVNADASDWHENLPDGLYITNGKKHIIKDGKLYSGR